MAGGTIGWTVLSFALWPVARVDIELVLKCDPVGDPLEPNSEIGEVERDEIALDMDPPPRLLKAFFIRLPLEAFLSFLGFLSEASAPSAPLLSWGLSSATVVCADAGAESVGDDCMTLRPDIGVSESPDGNDAGEGGEVVNDCLPSPSSMRRNAVTAVQPECILPSDSSHIRERTSSTLWNVLSSVSGIEVVGFLCRASRRYYVYATWVVVMEMRCVINAQDGHRCGLGAGIGKCELVKLPVETEIAVAYLMEMRSAPFRSMFSSVPVEDREKALPTDRVKIDYE